MNPGRYEELITEVRERVRAYRMELGFPKNKLNLTNSEFGLLLCEVGQWQDIGAGGDPRQLGKRWLGKPPWGGDKLGDVSDFQLTRAVARAMLFACPTADVAAIGEAICQAVGTSLFRGHVEAVAFDTKNLGVTGGKFFLKFPLRELLTFRGSESVLGYYAYDGYPSRRVLRCLGADYVTNFFCSYAVATGNFPLCIGLTDAAFSDDTTMEQKSRTRPRTLAPTVSTERAAVVDRAACNAIFQTVAFGQVKGLFDVYYAHLAEAPVFDHQHFKNLVQDTIATLEDAALMRAAIKGEERKYSDITREALLAIWTLAYRTGDLPEFPPARFGRETDCPLPKFHQPDAARQQKATRRDGAKAEKREIKPSVTLSALD